MFVFYTEIIKNSKIKNSKNNFTIAKEELLKEIYKCKHTEQSLFFGISCQEEPTAKIISDYFNNNMQLKNPYDNNEGFEGNPGSVQIEIKDKFFILSVDIDANGGIDIEDIIKY